MSTTTAQTTTRLCRWFGHLWHNDHTTNTVIAAGEPCVRPGCRVTRNDVPAGFAPGPITAPILPSLDRRIAELEHDEQERLIEQRIRTRLADQLHELRHRRSAHQPDSWFWAMTHAERTIRGDRP